MTASLLIAMPGNEGMTYALANTLGSEIAQIEVRAFPDGETYLRFATDLSGRTLRLGRTL
jgi:ribose-phosphate pyrophosphokinase